MNITIQDKILFNAKFVRNTTLIKHNTDSRKYEPETVSFVKFDPDNKKDFEGLSKLNKTWQDSILMSHIKRCGTRMMEKNPYAKGTNIYAVTSQTEDFDNLDPKKILSLAQTENCGRKKIYLRVLERNPRSNEYKKIGTATINALKEEYNKITLNSLEEAVKFYKNCGFKKKSNNANEFYWRKSLPKRIQEKHLFSHIHQYFDRIFNKAERPSQD